MDWLTALLAGAGESFPVEGAGSREDGLPHVFTAKVVRKPWGDERWLVAEGSVFGFKVITVRAGKRTSLQYHERKEEANFVIHGTGRMLLAPNVEAEVESFPLVPGQVVHVRPGTVHRVEAVTDLVIVEVSTPELDDVIRIADDTDRGSGRITSEHGNA